MPLLARGGLSRSVMTKLKKASFKAYCWIYVLRHNRDTYYQGRYVYILYKALGIPITLVVQQCIRTKHTYPIYSSTKECTLCTIVEAAKHNDTHSSEDNK
jgi:hypothetical protein